MSASAQVVIAIPGTPVPITGQTFGVLLVGAALGARRGLASMALYLVLGILGAPIFREGSHGIEKFFVAGDGGLLQFAPTGGYLVGMKTGLEGRRFCFRVQDGAETRTTDVRSIGGKPSSFSAASPAPSPRRSPAFCGVRSGPSRCRRWAAG
mgnify:CR=1 FL=1